MRTAKISCFMLFLFFSSLSYAQVMLKDGEKYAIEFVGQANLQKSIGESKDIPANTGLGVFYKRRFDKPKIFEDVQLEININVASTADTVKSNLSIVGKDTLLKNRRDFGSSVLLPSNSRQAAFVTARAFFYHDPANKPKKFFSKVLHALTSGGMYASLIGSNRVWEYNKNEIVNVANIGWKVGLFWEFIHVKEDREKYSIYFGTALTSRQVGGDLGLEKANGLRQRFLGLTDPTKNKFIGIEGNIGVRLRNLRAEIFLPYFYTTNGNQVDGLTGQQFVTTISFVGGFPLKLN